MRIFDTIFETYLIFGDDSQVSSTDSSSIHKKTSIIESPTGGKGVVIDIMRLLKAPNGQKDYDVQSGRQYPPSSYARREEKKLFIIFSRVCQNSWSRHTSIYISMKVSSLMLCLMDLWRSVAECINASFVMCNVSVFFCENICMIFLSTNVFHSDGVVLDWFADCVFSHLLDVMESFGCHIVWPLDTGLVVVVYRDGTCGVALK